MISVIGMSITIIRICIIISSIDSATIISGSTISI